MEQEDLEIISEIAGKYGFEEWALVGFTSAKEYHIFSYFSDLEVLPVFKAVLLSILKTIDKYFQKTPGIKKWALLESGTC